MQNDFNSEIQDLFFNIHTDLDLINSLSNVLTDSISKDMDIDNKDFANLIFIMKTLIQKLNSGFEEIISKLKL